MVKSNKMTEKRDLGMGIIAAILKTNIPGIYFDNFRFLFFKSLFFDNFAEVKPLYMSLLNNNKKKKNGKTGNQASSKSGFIPSKGKANTKGLSRNTKLTGGSQRGS